MYNEYFGFREAPFSIAPDPRYLYLSESHREALAHLLYAVGGQGALTLVTGEVGTGKTTVCRRFIEQVPAHVDVALVLNPRVNGREMLVSIAQELGLRFTPTASGSQITDALNRYLLDAHSRGRHTVLIIDEAQNLSAEVLEQLRLLTNLETSEKKLLQIILLGQPELQQMLEQRNLRQLNQRIGARYDLQPLSKDDIQRYISYRLQVAGRRDSLFTPGAVRRISRLSRGIPRLINLLADRSLLGAYSQNLVVVDRRTVNQAAKEVLPGGSGFWHRDDTNPQTSTGQEVTPPWLPVASLASVALALSLILWLVWHHSSDTQYAETVSEQSSAITPMDTIEQAGEQTGRALSPRGDREFLLGASDSDSRAQADQMLLQLWGHHYPSDHQDSMCEFALNRGLQCLHRNGNWRSLLQLDHPAILRLFNDQGEPVYGVLSELEQQRARIIVNGVERWVSRGVLDEVWLGEYSLVWRQPPFESRLVEPGTVRDRESWIWEALISAGLEDEGELPQQVVAFQREQGLVADGIAGPITLIRLNHSLGVPGPRLSGNSPGDASGGEG
ncbi:MAG: AAA family ATPase [Halomonadaceae bacterium]|nr:MAG: AAA family ATPase [Halomonadaceae bacterium]